MNWLQNKLEQWKKHRHEEKVLKDCGCVCYCECGATLNDQECEEISDGFYKYTCRCGVQRIFDFIHYPVPILVEK